MSFSANGYTKNNYWFRSLCLPNVKSFYQYFSKNLQGAKILLRINPKTLKGLELFIFNDVAIKSTRQHLTKLFIMI